MSKKKTKKKSLKAKKAIKIQRSSKHKVKKYVTIFFAGVFLLLVAWVSLSRDSISNIIHQLNNSTLQMTAQMGFEIKEVNITGRIRTDADVLREKLNINQGDPIFGFDTDIALNKITEIPWVESVDIRRALPDKIHIDLNERMPVAIWKNGAKLAVIDRFGHVLVTDNLDEFSYLPLLVGKNAKDKAEEIIYMLNAEPKITEYIDSVTLINDRRWDLKLHNKTIVKLPEKNPEFALSLLLKINKKDNILESSWDYIDMRLDGKITMKPAKGSIKIKNLKNLPADSG